MYFKGIGVPQDHAQAYLWTYLASTQEPEKAINTLDSLFKAFTPAQIEEGKKLVLLEWIATHPQVAQ